MKAIGLDLSLTGTGVVVTSAGAITHSECIKSKPCGKLPTDELVRLLTIANEIDTIVAKHKPGVAVIEGLAFMAKGTSLVQLAGLNYFVRTNLYHRNIPFYIVAPTSLKKFVTGSGKGDKNQMLLEIYKRYGESFLDDNVADAFGLAKIGEAVLGGAQLTSFQKEVIALVSKQS